MTRKIFRSIFLAVLVVIAASSALVFAVLYEQMASISRNQLKMQLQLAARGIETEGSSYFDDLSVSGYRITWIDADGTVLYDSSGTDTSQMENHLQREEIQEALKDGYGESTRYSTTLLRRSMYAAVRLSDSTILRMSVTQSSIFNLMLSMLQPAILILLFAVLLSYILAKQLSQRIVRPLNEIDLDHPMDNEGYDEIVPLLQRINVQQRELTDRRRELARKQEELDTILQNMNEGMILLRENGKILSINHTAEQLLGADRDCIGKNILTVNRDLELDTLIQHALNGRGEEKVIDLDGGRYQISTSPIMSEGSVQGAAILLFDVTDKEKAEQMRREFSANVSHELKTPLHAISGYAELMKSGMARTEDYKPFSEKIYKETQRTIQLVEDIISLSHLDEGAGDMEYEVVDLYEIVKDTAERLAPAADNASVKLTVTGSSCRYKGIKALLQTLVYNLGDNAIKYNHPGGKVSMDVHREKDTFVLTVRDNGMGIPEGDQKRIFERFYRVDKSHSRAIGGTGLGLSIVKHAAKIHNARINLKSKLGEGTTITVHFPV